MWLVCPPCPQVRQKLDDPRTATWQMAHWNVKPLQMAHCVPRTSLRQWLQYTPNSADGWRWPKQDTRKVSSAKRNWARSVRMSSCEESARILLQQRFFFFFLNSRCPSSTILLSLTKTRCCHCRLGAGGQCRRCLAAGRPRVKRPGDGYPSSSPMLMTAWAWLIEVVTNCWLTELTDSVTPSNT